MGPDLIPAAEMKNEIPGTTDQSWAAMRHKGTGPRYVKLGRKVSTAASTYGRGSRATSTHAPTARQCESTTKAPNIDRQGSDQETNRDLGREQKQTEALPSIPALNVVTCSAAVSASVPTISIFVRNAEETGRTANAMTGLMKCLSTVLGGA